MFSSGNIILQVIIPLIAAVICVILRKGKYAWFLATAATWLNLAHVITMVISNVSHGSVKYSLGGWEPPFGIEFQTDIFNCFILLIISFIAAVIMPYAKSSVEKEVSEKNQPLFYCVYLLCLTGLIGIASSNDIFNIYVFLEVASLASYTLVAMGNTRKARLSAFEYLILGTIGATFYLIGVGLIYSMTGSLNISDIFIHLPLLDDPRPIEAAFAFITVGLGMKIAIFPLHTWLVNSYTHAPSVISSFLSATGTKVSIYVLIRLTYMLFGYEFTFASMPLSSILIVFSLAAIVAGSVTAIYQKNVKRLLAYSSLAQIGYIMLGIALGTGTGLTASIVHLANHAIAKAGLFLAAGAIFFRMGGVTLEHFNGVGRKVPFTMAAFVITGLSLIGIPLTAGFISKWYLLQALIENEWWLMAIVVLLSSFISLIYLWKVIEAAYFKTPTIEVNEIKEAPVLMQLSMWVIAAANIYFGIYTDATLDIAILASRHLFGGI